MIRSAKPEDAAGAIDVIVAAELFPADETEPVEQLLADYFRGAAEEGHGFLVDADERELLGVAYYQPRPAADRVWNLTMIAIAPGDQREGREGGRC